jgi:hypothetical protein
VDVAILGMGLPSVYLASRLCAEGLSVGLFGGVPDMVHEPVSMDTVREFALDDFTLNGLSFFAHFDSEFRLREVPVSAATVRTSALHWHYLKRAMELGCEVLAGSEVSGGEVTWRGRPVEVDAGMVIQEEAGGREVPAVLAGRVPMNEDTVEFYDSPGTWVVPAGGLAVVGGEMEFAWSKFDRAAFLRTYSLQHSLPAGRLVGEAVKIGRAAGHTTREGFVLEPSLYHVRLLVDLLCSGGDLRVYEKAARKPPKSGKTGLRAWLER